MNEENKPIVVKFTPGYVPLYPSPYGFSAPDFSASNSGSFSSDAGWSQFTEEHPNVCPKCLMSDGLNENQKCKYCEYNNSKQVCEKCKVNTYRGEDDKRQKGLCKSCYDKNQAKALKKRDKAIKEQWRLWEEEQERNRIAWRAAVTKEKDEIIIDLHPDFGQTDYEEYEVYPKKLTMEQAIDLYEKLGRIVEDGT